MGRTQTRSRNYGTSFLRPALALAQGYLRKRSYTRTKYNRKKVNSGKGVTAQHDRIVQYKKSYMPKKKKKQWKNFVRRVTAVQTAASGTRTFIFNRPGTVWCPANSQNYASSVLLGRNGANVATPGGGAVFGAFDAGMSDLFDIFNQSSYSATQKILITSAVLDITYTNVGSYPIELDLYEVDFKRQSEAANISAAVTLAETQAPTINNWTALQLTDRGVGLFDLPVLNSSLGLTVLKKTKVFLPSSQSTTYQIRDPRNFWITREQASSDAAAGAGGFISPKKTRGVVAVFKNVAGFNDQAANLAIGSTHKYAVKFFVDARVADGYA